MTFSDEDGVKSPVHVLVEKVGILCSFRISVSDVIFLKLSFIIFLDIFELAKLVIFESFVFNHDIRMFTFHWYRRPIKLVKF